MHTLLFYVDVCAKYTTPYSFKIMSVKENDRGATNRLFYFFVVICREMDVLRTKINRLQSGLSGKGVGDLYIHIRVRISFSLYVSIL